MITRKVLSATESQKMAAYRGHPSCINIAWVLLCIHVFLVKKGGLEVYCSKLQEISILNVRPRNVDSLTCIEIKIVCL